MTEHIAAHSSSTPDFTRERFLSPAEAATFLNGLNPRTVTRWAREGYLPAYPIGEWKRGIKAQREKANKSRARIEAERVLGTVTSVQGQSSEEGDRNV